MIATFPIILLVASGGVLYAQISNSIIIQRSNFVKNNVYRSGTVAVLLEKSEMIVVEGKFIENEAGLEGGAIKARYQSSVAIINSIFPLQFCQYLWWSLTHKG